MLSDTRNDGRPIGSASEDDKRAISASLEHMLSDSNFIASPRSRSFLSFIVKESLLGRGEKLKSYTIGVDVFGRDKDFDATVDPGVRVEASRLRKSLDDYYSLAKNLPNPRITLPKGRYIPTYIYDSEGAEKEVDRDPLVNSESEKISEGSIGADQRSDSRSKEHERISADGTATAQRVKVSLRQSPLLLGAVVAAMAAALAISIFAPGWLRSTPSPSTDPGQPVVIVDHITSLNDDRSSRVQTLDFALVSALSRFDVIRVVQHRETLCAQTSFLSKLLQEEKAPVYLLESNARITNDLIEVNWRLSNARTLVVLWSDTATEQRANTNTAEAEIARRISAFVAERQWLLGSDELRSTQGEAEPGYACIVRARAYLRTSVTGKHDLTRDCLEKTVKIYPNYADAWYWLAAAYTDEYRFDANSRGSPEDALNRLEHAAKRGIEVAPFSAAAQAMAALSAHLSGNDEMTTQAANRALSINPDDTRVLAITGYIYLSQGEYERASNLIDRAYSIANHSLDSSSRYFFLKSVIYYSQKKYEHTIEHLNNFPEKNYLMDVFLAASYGKLGDVRSARLQVERLLKAEPNFAVDGRKLLARQRFNKALIDDLIDGLRAAGLDLKP